MCGSSTTTVAAPAPPPRLAEAPRTPDVSSRGTDTRRRAAGQGGRSTILTGPRGVQDGGATAQKTLLGQ